LLARSPSLNQAWIKSIPLAANTVRQIIMDVGQVYRAAIEDNRITKNPLRSSSVQKPARQKHQAVAWTGEQVMAIEAELPAHLSAMAPLGASCGHRQGELFAVADIDIDWLRKMCHIEWQVKYLDGKLYFAALKNKNVRDVPIADHAVFALARHVEQFPSVDVTLPLLLPNGTIGEPVTRKLIFTRPEEHALTKAQTRASANNHWEKARKRAGIPFVKQATGMHVLRHTAATNWLANGLSIAMVAFYLGDTQETVVATYSHVLPSDETRARAIVNAFFAPPKAPSHETGAQNVPLTGSGEV
jgi:integrase